MVDYRELLKKYMKVVCDWEADDYLSVIGRYDIGDDLLPKTFNY